MPQPRNGEGTARCGLEKTMKTPNRFPVGEKLLRDPRLNKGTAFTEAERDAFGLRGLLPPRVLNQAEQQVRVLENFSRKPSDLDKYIFMTGLQDRNETAFYRTVIDNIELMMPIIYTPTVGEACQKFARIFRRPRGMFISMADKGRVTSVLRNWPERDVAVIVVTDGERILGLGDLGANGMGIPVGKLSLYTACAGVHPSRCLPIVLDTGTENETLRSDPLYLGWDHPRWRGQKYDDFVEEFVVGVGEVFPSALIQFEDFATQNAIGLLAKYRDRVCTFNDDIQGTAAVTLAGLLSAAKITGQAPKEQKIVFLGAGSAATGIADLMVSSMVRDGLDEEGAKSRCWFVDSKGLVVKSRDDLAAHKRPYAHEHEFVRDLLSVITELRPTTLVGVSGQPGTFDEAVLRAMADVNERPVVFALSNPTSKAECTAQQAYEWTEGRAVFASGSPFDPVDLDGTRYVPRQGNNSYIFPGIGLGVVVSGARRVTDEMFLAAAQVLADEVADTSLAQGSVYPPLTRIRDVSAAIGAQVARVAVTQGLATRDVPDDTLPWVRGQMYEPVYSDYV